MKKFFYLFVAAVTAVAFTSCGDDPVVNNGIKITISEVESTTAQFSCTPNDLEAPYFFSYATKEDFDQFTPEELAEEMVAELDYMIEFYGLFGYELTYADFANYGELNDVLDELTPNTEYVAFAYYFDVETGKATSDFSTAKFKTEELKELGKVNVNIVSPEWYDYVAEEGWWQVLGAESKDTAYFVSLSPIACEAVVGTYTLADMDPDYTIIDDAAKGGEFGFADLEVKITEDGENYNIVANGLALNGYRYNITFDPINKNSALKAPARSAEPKASKAQVRFAKALEAPVKENFGKAARAIKK